MEGIVKPKAFILMPFATEFDEIFTFLIHQGVQDAGFDVTRADNLLSQNNILKDILNSIVNSDLIIADLTGSNANVYYELGIAHAFKKPVILLTQDITDLPFDLRSYRVIPYGTHFAKMGQAKNELTELAKEFLTGKVPFGSPVSDFVDFASLVQVSSRSSEKSFDDAESDPGFLDYMVMFEEVMESLGQVVTAVGEQLNLTTPKIVEFTEKVNSNPNLSNKQKRDAVQVLAGHIENYGNFIKPRNIEYRNQLRELEQSLEFILSGKIPHEDNETLQGFIDTLESVEASAYEGKGSFQGLAEMLDAFPNMEKNLDKAYKFMSRELRAFISNTDQMISILSRAKIAGKSLLLRNEQKFNSPSNKEDAPDQEPIR